MAAVNCVRGTQGELPEIRKVANVGNQVERFAAEQAAARADAGSIAPDSAAAEDGGVTDPFRPDRAWIRGLQLLRLLPLPEPPDPTMEGEDSPEPVFGFYEWSQKRIALFEAVRLDAPGDQLAFAHELVHAVQDQEGDLGALDERLFDTVDARVVRDLLIEGEAALYGELAFELLNELPLDRERFAVHRKYGRSVAVRSGAPFWGIYALGSSVGASYLIDAWLEAGNAGVTAVFEDPPRSSIYWLLGYRAAQELREELVLSLACPRAALPEGYRRFTSTSLGALHLFGFLGHHLRDGQLYATEELWRDAKGWRQDNLSVFEATPARTAVSWRILFDSRERAEALGADLTALDHAEWSVFVRGSELEILASDDPGTLAEWNGTDPEACPAPGE